MTATRYFDTLAPGAISDELAPVVAALGLEQNCRQLHDEGWTVLTDVATPELNAALREAILTRCRYVQGRPVGAQMLLAADPVFADAVLDPRLLAMAEFSVGRGFLLSQVAGSVRPPGSPTIGLHADNNWVPAPFPAHNLLLTCCWATDGYTREGGSTLVVPGSNRLHRHPDADEVRAEAGAVAIVCPPGSVAMWDGNLWHSNYPRTIEGDRVVCHITYSRLMMRPVEDYADHADALVAAHGDRMAQLLGRRDGLFGRRGFEYDKLVSTFNDAKR